MYEGIYLRLTYLGLSGGQKIWSVQIFGGNAKFFIIYYIDLIKSLRFAQKIWADQSFCPPDKQENCHKANMIDFSMEYCHGSYRLGDPRS